MNETIEIKDVELTQYSGDDTTMLVTAIINNEERCMSVQLFKDEHRSDIGCVTYNDFEFTVEQEYAIILASEAYSLKLLREKSRKMEVHITKNAVPIFLKNVGNIDMKIASVKLILLNLSKESDRRLELFDYAVINNDKDLLIRILGNVGNAEDALLVRLSSVDIESKKWMCELLEEVKKTVYIISAETYTELAKNANEFM